MIKIISHKLKIKDYTKNSNVQSTYYESVIDIENTIFLNNIFLISNVQKKVKIISELESKNMQLTNDLKKKLIHLNFKTMNGKLYSYEYYYFNVNNLELEFFEEEKAIEEYNKIMKKIELKHTRSGLWSQV